MLVLPFELRLLFSPPQAGLTALPASNQEG